jgi:hypothetical protein
MAKNNKNQKEAEPVAKYDQLAEKVENSFDEDIGCRYVRCDKDAGIARIDSWIAEINRNSRI